MDKSCTDGVVGSELRHGVGRDALDGLWWKGDILRVGNVDNVGIDFCADAVAQLYDRSCTTTTKESWQYNTDDDAQDGAKASFTVVRLWCSCWRKWIDRWLIKHRYAKFSCSEYNRGRLEMQGRWVLDDVNVKNEMPHPQPLYKGRGEEKEIPNNFSLLTFIF